MAGAPALQAGGRGFESLILHSVPVQAGARFFDMLEGDTRENVVAGSEIRSCESREREHHKNEYREVWSESSGSREVTEGARWMPRLL